MFFYADFTLKMFFTGFHETCSKSKANGVAQFPVRSINSHIGSPERGRLNAVTKAQNIAQMRIIRNGLINIIRAIEISKRPIIGINVMATSLEKPNMVISGIQLSLTPNAI